jgi:glucan 1,3-beta-glucosidase
MQNNPDSLSSFTPNPVYSDPTFEECYQAVCYKTFALRFFNSTYIFVYGAGLYSFFNNYDQGCLLTESCQILMVALEQSQAIYTYALSTKAALNMVEVDQVAIVPQAANKNGFCQTVAVFEYP